MNLTQAFPRHRTLRVGSVDTYVAEAGEGPPVLLLHGSPDTHAVWSEVVARLATRFRCIAPDLPGFGRSRAPGEFDCSLDNQAAFVRDLLAALELPRVHLVVHDIGGVYGLAFATQQAPRLSTLTIFNTNFFPDYRWHFWARVWRMRMLGELTMAVTNRPMFVRELRRGSPRMPDVFPIDRDGAKISTCSGAGSLRDEAARCAHPLSEDHRRTRRRVCDDGCSGSESGAMRPTRPECFVLRPSSLNL